VLPWLPKLALTLQLGLDGLSLPLVLLTALITAMAILSTPEDQPRSRLFFSLLLATNLGLTLAFLAGNALLFVLAYELILIPTTLLVASFGREQRASAAIRFLIFNAISGLAAVAGGVIYWNLAKRGWAVTQSTLSRDLRELRLARIPDTQGNSRYAFSDATANDEELAQLERMLPQLLTAAEGVQVLVVARTIKSGAQPVAEALDQLEWPDVAGTIAGDDTVLVICRSTEGRERVLKKLRAYLRTA
jgi:arginine repressor